MELRHVRYFLAVAEERNFTRAAAKVGIGQPPLSLQIRALEEELGCTLFRRLPHGAELTEAGVAFLPEARALVEQAKRAMVAAGRGARGEVGRLRVGFTGSAAFDSIVPTSIRLFASRHPEVELTLDEAPTASLLERLARNELDAVFIRPGRSTPEGVQAHRLSDEAMVVALPTSHPLAKADALPLSALARERFVLFSRHAGPGLFDEVIVACRSAGFEPMLGHEAPQLSSIGPLIAAGLGVSLVPASLAQIRVAGVEYIPIAGKAPVAGLTLAIRPEESSPVVHNFLEVVLSGKAPAQSSVRRRR
ncbi:LysR family transcriptional regulator [Hyalangium versicolor]|uniref:LysR family transcriptional regulator n=1 Tax=Hyalangium versicolor TaxID=2861190 RepID=UPI001CCE5DEE|nr:LysR family transcriptional regulator [Hyalangium versicolor]